MAELTLVDALAQLSFLVQGRLERLAGERQLSLASTRLLGVLRDRTPTMNEIGALLELDKSSVSGLVDRAERRALVRRVPSPTDRRSVLVELTTAGRRLVDEVAAAFEKEIASLVKHLAASDRRALGSLAERVLVAHADRAGFDLRGAGRGAPHS